MRKFTKKEDSFLKRNYAKIPAKRMAKMLNRSEGTARQRMKLLGIVVPPEIVQKFKDESRFKKGQEPPNKGKRMADYLDTKTIAKIKKTQFKKGSTPVNHRLIGSERISKDGYIEIKVKEPRKWMLKHRFVYEQHFGKIPKGYNVEFKDRNRQNLDPSNLILRTRKENMLLNTVHNYPKEIADTIQLLGALQRQINKKQAI